MIELPIAIIFAISSFFSLYGYGLLFTQRLIKQDLPPGMTAGFGLAVLVILGGFLNLGAIAWGINLDLLMLAGIVLAINHVRKDKSHRPAYPGHLLLALALFIAMFLVFGKTAAFNYHDDMEKYLAQPLRMLATGTLGGSDYNALGSETLGAQAFLQSFLARHFDLVFVPSVDLAFAATLAALVLAEACSLLHRSRVTIVLAIAILFCIPPQVVNISSVYTGALLFLLLGLIPQITDSDVPKQRAVCYALLYAALLALKSSFAFILLLHAITLLGFSLKPIAMKHKGTGLDPNTGGDHHFSFRHLFGAGFFSLLLVIPWIATHAPISTEIIYSHPYPLTTDTFETANWKSPIELFRLSAPFYAPGTTMLGYTLLVILGGTLAGWICFRKRYFEGSKNKDKETAIFLVAMLPANYVVSMMLLAPWLLALNNGLRYLSPAFIALIPLSIILASKRKDENKTPSKAAYPALLSALLILGMFAWPTALRFKQALDTGIQLPFPGLAYDRQFQGFNKAALDKTRSQPIHSAQDALPVKATVLSWTIFNFQLDYERNRIIDINPAGLTTPWLKFPFSPSVPENIKHLRAEGIDYILWQHRGYGIRDQVFLGAASTQGSTREKHIATRTLQLTRFMQELHNNLPVVYEDPLFYVFKVKATGTND